MITLSVPTINDRRRDFEKLFGLWSQVNGDNLNVTIDFFGCRFLRQNAVAFLGGIVQLIEYRGGRVGFNWESLAPDVRKNLDENGFIGKFLTGEPPRRGNAIPYREDVIQDKDGLVDYLKSQWLGRDWVHVSRTLRDEIVGRLWEIYANAFEHAQSPVGIASCGQHFPRRRELNLTVVDFGVGIPSNVRVFKKNDEIPSKNAMKWAFQRGTSTKPNGVGRGVGLDLLKEFVRVTGGRLEVFSHEGYALVDDSQETFGELPTFFEGTLVNIVLKCDERFYRLATEKFDDPLF